MKTLMLVFCCFTESAIVIRPNPPFYGRRRACQKCGKVFNRSKKLREHMASHGEPDYQCAKCGRFFPDANRLLMHTTGRYSCYKVITGYR